ncbi:MAG: virulence RhuM family protein [Bacteroidales bacterium]|nr:virulence RhuM family protein [Bacteroidales bacterium]MBR6928839.1 virulence RhuM family protein [Bacteroidales bacterium]
MAYTSVGHRVKSQRGMQFRQWVNRHIRHNICSSFPF